ncbi:thiol:disulfide interchange protein DsbA [Providencia sp. PROV188]|jgi:thiol:disulfide interchange protein DsbA|uniref:Thiol:disulfide interchange protein n=2 Tax=Providencia TaxID=586 RepID=A0A4R3NHY8_9GAMM|nr:MULTISPECIES: thiol:disulfide interchange protein DsbA [Providencia]MTC74690.1 thiol:disulfide interchange protein DsbA [Providencia sp. wls1919]ETT03000.1 thiol:disulfide interchange protein DsbA [Providencia alcalifaciens PAL-3]EUC98113.1 thiol:disulfide interchange protein DsbA [Providencia alcalifaciens PAL-1]MBC5789049.1 thiol:disulfide interchange protein DsbA [Providencia sp. JUb39]MBG5883472.1 thiol:disulfide interchange protein DsbA [Providencia alcalifaciens]
MKKIMLALIGIAMSFGAAAANYSEGKEYTDVKPPVQDLPQVLEFFSFYCPHCYQFESIYKVPQTVEKNLPEGVTKARYHVDFLGPLGAQMTQAWAVAMVLKVEDKVTPILFEGIQKTQTINTPADIRNAFIKAGVTGEEYDAALNSFVVKSLVAKQQNAAQDLKLRGVPALFVDGKYQIRNNGISVDNAEDYAKEYSKVVNFLVSKK